MKRLEDNTVSTWWVESVLADNTIDGDFDLYMDCESLTRYPTYRLMIDEKFDASKFVWGAAKSAVEHDLEEVMIRPMLKRSVLALPSASLSGNVVSFDHDEVVLNGVQYINLAGTWTPSYAGAIASPSSPSVGDFLVYTSNGWAAQSLSTWQGGSY